MVKKLKRHERIKITHQIEDTLENYCRVCPHYGSNVKNPVCVKCPINADLQSYGKHLGFVEDNRGRSADGEWITWTEKEEEKLIKLYKERMKPTVICKELGRSYGSVYNKIRKLQDRGVL